MWTVRRSRDCAARRSSVSQSERRVSARLGRSAGIAARCPRRTQVSDDRRPTRSSMTVPRRPQSRRGAARRCVGARLARFVGEEAMTRSTSPRAVCCSSASRELGVACSSSSNSRAFSMAMTAWSANVSSSAICWSRERADLACRATSITPIGVTSRSSGVGEGRPLPDAAMAARAGIGNSVGSAARSSNVDRPPVDDRPPADRPARWHAWRRPQLVRDIGSGACRAPPPDRMPSSSTRQMTRHVGARRAGRRSRRSRRAPAGGRSATTR